MRQRPAGLRRDQGFALIAAVLSILVFAAVALTVQRQAQSHVTRLAANLERARLAAAVQAGLALGIHGVAIPDRTQRWAIDGRSRQIVFDGLQVTIQIQDQRGLVPLNGIDLPIMTALFEAVGVTGERLTILTQSLQDWQDDNPEPLPFGAETAYYTPLAIAPRDAPLRTLDELGQIRGFDAALIARLRPLVTLWPDSRGGFERSTANPIALGVLLGGGPGSPDVIQRERELKGQRPALEIADTQSLVGRPLGINITASSPRGGQLTQRYVIELTGLAAVPYLVRAAE